MNAARVDFSSWDLQEHIASAVQANGWSEPTEIQREAIPLARPVSYTHLTLPAILRV